MFCVKCQADLLFCSCPDLIERLGGLLKNPVLRPAVEQNLERIKALEEQPKQ